MGVAYILDAPSRKIDTCSLSICNANQHTKFLLPSLISFEDIEGGPKIKCGGWWSPQPQRTNFCTKL